MSHVQHASDIFDSAALVVAHPDDEVLWFSSILDRVRRAVICYEDCDDLPELGPGRRRVMQAYPLTTTRWLRRSEPCSLPYADWSDPVATEFGMALNAKASSVSARARYEDAYRALSAELGEELRGITHVFTHNPWGEYGHPDHVQVSRVVSDLGRQLGFQVWYSSYVSPRSLAFAAPFLARLSCNLRLSTAAKLAAEICALYKRHRCWTWHAELTIFPDEAFLQTAESNPPPGRALPLNCVFP